MGNRQTASNSAQPNFFEIKDSAMITKILDVTVRYKVPVTLWLKEQSIRLETKITAYDKAEGTIKFSLGGTLSTEDFEKAIKSQGEGVVFGSFQIDGVNFFVKTPFMCVDDKKLIQIEAPKQIYKL